MTANQQPGAATPRVALRVENVAKRFGETQALRDCTLDLREAEVLALMGENGSGKSTLVKILSGVLAPDSGSLHLGGRSLARIDPPRAAQGLGIGVVFQEILVVPTMSVYDNLFLGADPLMRASGRRSDRRPAARALLSRLLGESLDLDVAVGTLSLSQRQVIVIVRALLRDPTVLLLDEATSALDVEARQRLFELLRERRAGGRSAIFISHRLDEVEEIADRVTVLRSGISVGTLDRAEARAAAMVALMSGTEHPISDTRAAVVGHQPGDERVRVSDLVLRPGREPFSTQIRAGEIVGLAGLEGHGQDEFLRVLAGIDAPVAGSVTASESQLTVRSGRDAARAHIAYVPRERKTEGIFAPLSILDNFAVASLGSDRRWGLLSGRSAAERLRGFVQRLGIRSGRPGNRITTLSGGNQQKVVMARWLATEPHVLLLNDPTRGVDHGTKQDIYAELGTAAQQGIAVVMLSTEVDEHVALMDRVLVFREGGVSIELPRERLDRHRLVSAFFGGSAE